VNFKYHHFNKNTQLLHYPGQFKTTLGGNLLKQTLETNPNSTTNSIGNVDLN